MRARLPFGVVTVLAALLGGAAPSRRQAQADEPRAAAPAPESPVHPTAPAATEMPASQARPPDKPALLRTATFALG